MSFFSELDPELSRRTPEELMHWFGDPANLSAEDLLLDEVAVRIAEAGGAEGIDYLLSNLRGADEGRVQAALLGLSLASGEPLMQKGIEIRAAVRDFLGDARPLVVARAIDSLTALGCAGEREDVLRLLSHASPYVVGSVLRFMARHHPDEAIPLLERSLESPEPIVRQNAVDELDDLGWVKALPHIKPLLHDPDKDVRQAAQTAVENLEDLKSDLEEIRTAV